MRCRAVGQSLHGCYQTSDIDCQCTLAWGVESGSIVAHGIVTGIAGGLHGIWIIDL